MGVPRCAQGLPRVADAPQPGCPGLALVVRCAPPQWAWGLPCGWRTPVRPMVPRAGHCRVCTRAPRGD